MIVSALNGVLANDSDGDGDALTAQLVAGPSNGAVTLNSDGSFSYTPNSGFNGIDSFSYQATDGIGQSNTAIVTLNVHNANNSPVANDDFYGTLHDTTLVVPAAGVLANDSDPDGDPLTSVLVSGPSHGTLTLNSDGSFSYMPNTNYVGSDSFTYKANDGAADSYAATVVLDVYNNAPLAGDDTYLVLHDQTLVVDAAGVLVNDIDPDGDPLSALLVSGPSQGSLTLNSNGSFTYTPNSGFAGNDSFVYAATDQLAFTNAFVSLIVGSATGPTLDITAFRPRGQRTPFQRTAVPAATEDTVGAGVRSNGDDDNNNGTADWGDAQVPGENDLIEISLDFGFNQVPQGIRYFLKRSNANIKVWDSATKGGAVLNANNEQEIPFSPGLSLWVEWVNPTFAAADATLTFEARDAQTNAVVGTPDSVRVFRFTSVVIAIGGRLQAPTDPPNPNQGVFVIGRTLYATEAYDVHMFAEGAQNTGFLNVAGRGAAYNEVVNAVNNRRVGAVSVFGYSWGGGATFNLVDRLVTDAAAGLIQNPFSIPYTAYIDGVQHGNANLGNAEIRRPTSSQFHVNYYERIGTPGEVLNVRGNAVPGSNFQLNVNTTQWGANLNHFLIDDDVGGGANELLGLAGRNVLNGVRDRLITRVDR